jgi:hypothetical protein
MSKRPDLYDRINTVPARYRRDLTLVHDRRKLRKQLSLETRVLALILGVREGERRGGRSKVAVPQHRTANHVSGERAETLTCC